MNQIMCANTNALDKHLREVQSGEERWIESEEELYKLIDPVIEALRNSIKHHVRFNDAGMDYNDARNYVIETIGELL